MTIEKTGALMAWDSRACGYRRRCCALVAFASFLVLGSVGPAGAAEPSRDAKQEAKARFIAGQSHYNLNEFTEALREFKEAYRLYPDPVFLFNLGQCERQLDHYEEAIRFYRTFLREQPKAPNRQDVVHKIAEMEAALKAKEAEEKAAPVTPPPSLAPKAVVPVAPVAPAGPGAGAGLTPAAAGSPPGPAGAATGDFASAATASPVPPAAPPAGAEPTDTATPALDLSTAPVPEPETGRAPIYKRWWFWTAAAAVAIGAGVGIYAATASDGLAIPSSELGSRKVF
jgi:tetratricopeptide (TPR) repeat protein